jgi:hypothetical protein
MLIIGQNLFTKLFIINVLKSNFNLKLDFLFKY